MKFDIEMYPNGKGKVVLDGQDISGYVMAVGVFSSVTDPPLVRLEVRPSELKLSGEGLITVGTPVDLDEVLATFDAAEIEENALERLGWGDGGNMTAKVIEVLRERVREHTDRQSDNPE